MNNFPSFQEFLETTSAQVPITHFITRLILAGLLSWVLTWVYVRYGGSLSNRRSFARNFVPLSLTTMLIIQIVKSSLALSLGLVGALSIIRFRAAIKEPEELTYLFLAIAIGLGFGADQGLITFVAFTISIMIIALLHMQTISSNREENLYITVSSKVPAIELFEEITNRLEEYSQRVVLKRLDESSDFLEATFFIEFSSFGNLCKAKNELKNIDKNITVSFLET